MEIQNNNDRYANNDNDNRRTKKKRKKSRIALLLPMAPEKKKNEEKKGKAVDCQTTDQPTNQPPRPCLLLMFQKGISNPQGIKDASKIMHVLP